MKKIFNLFTHQFASVIALVMLVGVAYGQCPIGQAQVTVTYTTGGFNGENGWALVNASTAPPTVLAGFQNPPAGATSVCAPQGSNIQLLTFETFGDGWCAPAMITAAITEDGSANNMCLFGANSADNMCLFEVNPVFAPLSAGAGASGNGAFSAANLANGVVAGSVTTQSCPDCVITCPDDIVVGNDTGVCGAFIECPPPSFDPMGCNLETPINPVAIDESIEFANVPGFANGGFANNPGTYTLSYSLDSLCNFPLPVCVDEICFDIVYQGDLDFTTEQIIITSPQLPNLMVDTDANGYTQCSVGTETVCLDAAMWETLRAGCVLDLNVEATGTGINTGLCAFNGISVVAESFTDCDVFSASVMFADGSEGPKPVDGVFPVGCNLVTYSAIAGTFISGGTGGTGSGTGSGTAGGGAGGPVFGEPGIPTSCSFTITVEDDEAPVLSCPRDFTFNLQSGECCEVYDYDIAVFNNCPLDATTELVMPLVSVDEPMNDNNGGATGWTIYFDVTNNTGVAQGLSTFNHPTIGTPTSCTVWTTPGTSMGNNANAAAWTQIPSTNGVFMPGAMTGVFGTGTQPIVLDEPVILAPGETVGIAINCVGAGPAYFNGPCAPFTQNGMTITGNASSTALFAGAVFTPRCWPGEVLFGEPIPVPAFEFVSGLMPGDAVGVGSFETIYTATDAAGNMSECSWTVTVNDIPNVTESLTCDDQVNVSVDENCQVLITADMFLEGGPYSCLFDCYEVYVLDAFGNPVVSNCIAPLKSELDASDVNQNGLDLNGCTVSLECGTYTYEVYDACRDNLCWGEFTVEDKLAPVIIAPEDATITCMQSSDPSPDCAGSTQASFASIAIPATGTVSTTTTIAGIPAAAVVTEVTLDMTLTHSWVGDITATLTGPNGATVTLVDNPCGGGNNENIIATFDDTNGAAQTCANLNLLPVQDCSGPVPTMADLTGVINTNSGDLTSAFEGTSALGDWTLEINDPFGGDGGCLYSAGLNVAYNIPGVQAATLATGISFVDVDGNEVDSDTPGAIQRGCDDELTFIDDFFAGDCGEAFILRTWVATDSKGNQSSVQQRIDIIQVGASGLGADWFWPTEVVDLECGVDSSPQGIYDFFRAEFEATTPCPDPESCDEPSDPYNRAANTAGVLNAFPQTLGKDGNLENFVSNSCNLIFDFTDNVLDACGEDCPGNQKIIRTWTVLDWCNSVTLNNTQIIHAKDNTGPVIDMDGAGATSVSMTVGVNPWGCVAEFELPEPEHLTDNCSPTVEYTVSGPANVSFVPREGTPGVWVVSGAPKGTHTFTYTATDCCGNEGTGTVVVTVIDNSAPQPIATQNIVVGLTFSPTNPEAGSAKIFVDQIDNGSHDGSCGPVITAIRRVDGDGCGNIGNNGHDNNTTFFNFNDLPDNQQPTDHSRNDTDGGQFVKFCCNDLLTGDGEDLDGDGVNDYVNITVELGVWDDANMDGWPGTPGDLFARTWATVRLEAKVNPVLQCPPNARIDCREDETGDFAISQILGRATASTACGAVDVEFNDVCGWDQNGDGDLNDTFFMGSVSPPVPDVSEEFNKACHYGPVVRTWNIVGTNISCSQIIIITEPTEVFSGSYYLVDANGNYILNGTRPIENDNITFPFERDAVDINDDNFDDFSEVQVDCIDDLGNPEPTWVDSHCSLIGWSLDSDTINFEDGACRKIINEYCVIDWCQFDPSGGPIIPNNGDFKGNTVQPGKWCWTVIGKLIDPYAPVVTAANDMFDANPAPGGSGGFPSANTCVGSGITMTATAFDGNTDADGNVQDDACPSSWLQWVALVDINNDWSFDFEYSSFIPEGQQLFDDTNGNGIPDVQVGEGSDSADGPKVDQGDYTISIPAAIPADCGATQHRVEWTVYDGCGNLTSTTSYFTVQDKKAPTPFCVNLSTALMDIPAGGSPEDAMVEIWAIDFDNGSFDNCTGDDELLFTFTDDLSTVNPEFRSAAMRFDCEALGGTDNALVTLPIYVWDGCGNRDFCLVNLRIIDNNGNCGGTSTGSLIAGTVSTESGQMVENVEVMNEVMPGTEQTMMMTESNGEFFFHEEDNRDYQLTGSKNDDYSNGVSTIDIVMIQRHILGIETFDSAYDMIAADVNGDSRIDGADLVELRKLVLGIYTELPQNDSWRFVNADQTLDVANPWSFDETIEVMQLSADMNDEDFIGVKIGDVSGDVVANAIDAPNTANRVAGAVTIDFDNVEVAAGQTVQLTVTANQADLYGYQFTLATPGLQLVDVQSANLNVTEANFGVFGDVVTTSWNDTKPMNATGELFTLTFTSNVEGQLAEILDLNSSVTKAEAYVGSNLNIVDVELASTNAVSEFALNQNEPNPFSANTTIGFVLAEAANTTMTVYDVTGKVITVIRGDYPQGYNEIELSKSDLGASGVLYYQLDSGDFTATKKMIVIE